MTSSDPEIPGRIDLDGDGRNTSAVGSAGRLRFAVLASIMTVALIAALVVAVGWWRPWPGPGVPASAPSWSVTEARSATPAVPSVSRSSGARPPATGAGLDPTVIDSGDFGPWRCDVSAEMPQAAASFPRWARQVLACARTVYGDRLEPLAGAGDEPDVRFVDGWLPTPCGTVDAAAYFCPGDATIYLDVPRLRRFADDNRLAVVSVLLHEYTHAVQHRLGVLTRTDRPERPMTDPDERVRRIELQADCLSLGLVSRWREAEWTETDRGRFLEWRFSGHDREHGSDASRIRWLLAGLDGQDFAACDTWSAPSWQVR